MKIIKKDFRYPNENSPKKKWYYTIECEKCGTVVEKIYLGKKFIPMCVSCTKGGWSIDEFINKAQEIHGDVYTYDMSYYTGYKNKLTITCKIHGDFEQKPSDHLNGSGCKKCSAENYGDKIRYDLTHWHNILKDKPHLKVIPQNKIGYREKCTIVCNKHNTETITKFSNIRQNSLICPICVKMKHQKQSIRDNLLGTRSSLYYLYLPDVDMYKLGVTRQELHKRFVATNYKLLWCVDIVYEDAIEIEHILHNELTDYRNIDIKVLTTGNTELYTSNILPNKESLITLLRGLHKGDLVSKII